MAYTESKAQSIREIFSEKQIKFTEKKMFGGLCFLVDDKMCCGTHTDKVSGKDLLLCRIGEEFYNDALKKPECIPMEFTGKPMIGFVFITEGIYKNRKDLEFWLQKCLDYNPIAKKSKRK